MSPGGRRHGSAAGGGATRSTIGLLGLFGVGNLGNDGSFEVGLAMAREFAPDADVVCITPSPGDISRRFGLPTVRMREPRPLPAWLTPRGPVRLALWPLAEIRRWIDTYRAARGLNVVAVPGTGVLDDFGLRPQGVPYILFRWALCCRLARTPFAFVGIGAGPIKHPTSRRLMGWAARLATHRSYRDPGSAAYMAELGAPGHFTPDVVFGDERLRPDPDRYPDSESAVVGVGIMSYAGWTDHVVDGASDSAEASRDYLERIIDLVGRILDDGDEVTLLVGAHSDLATVRTVVSAVEASGRPIEGRLHTPEITNLSDLCRELELTDGAIVTRYHNLVCSLIARRACVPIGYESKFDELSESVGLSAFGHRAGSFETKLVLDDLATAQLDRATHARRIDERLAEFSALVRRDFATVFGDA
jgi:polysaccharide pyruvyl transferase WcaK-like protein